MTKQIKVRIPFALDSGGEWEARSWNGAPDEECMKHTCGSLVGDILLRRWIVATIDVPDDIDLEIQGAVEE